jgi:hypothetical protein
MSTDQSDPSKPRPIQHPVERLSDELADTFGGPETFPGQPEPLIKVYPPEEAARRAGMVPRQKK